MKMTKIKKTGKYCRYHFCLIEHMSVTEAVINTKEIFNNSWNIFAYNTKENLIPIGATIEKSWLYQGLIVFSSINIKMGDWYWKVRWDEIGAWHYSFYPKEFPLEIKYNDDLHQKKIELIKRTELIDYFQMSKEWKMIHDLGADLSIIKQGDSVLIASLDKLTINKFKKVVSLFNKYQGPVF